MGLVELHNAGKQPITQVRISIAGNELEMGAVDPGASRSYVSPPFEDEFRIVVREDGSCQVGARPAK